LYFDDNKLQNTISHFVLAILALKAISAEVTLAAYKLHESQKVFFCQFLWYWGSSIN